MSSMLCCEMFVRFRGDKFHMVPYVVKGMDVSFSGILSHIEEQIGSTFMKQVYVYSVLIFTCCAASVWMYFSNSNDKLLLLVTVHIIAVPLQLMFCHVVPMCTSI